MAAVADGAIPRGDTPPNDYYVRNVETGGFVLAVGADVVVTRINCSRGCSEGLLGDVDDLAASFGSEEGSNLMSEYRGSRSQYRVTVADGRVTRIDEQYVP